MNIEELREYCLSHKSTTEELMFKDEYLVFRVLGKWFAVVPLNDSDLTICLKCDPTEAIELRERYNCVEPAWHFNKKYWNSVILNRDMDDKTVKYWISHSIDEVVKKMQKKIQLEYLESK